MLTLEDCIGLSGLDEEEILAIAEHEHLPEMLAVEMGCYLCHTPDGDKRIRRMIADDIRHAHALGDVQRTALLKSVLKHYVQEHHGNA